MSVVVWFLYKMSLFRDSETNNNSSPNVGDVTAYKTHLPPLLHDVITENTGSSIVAQRVCCKVFTGLLPSNGFYNPRCSSVLCWTVLTEPLPGNALIKSLTVSVFYAFTYYFKRLYFQTISKTYFIDCMIIITDESFVKDCCLLGYNTVYSGRSLTMFRRNELTPSSGKRSKFYTSPEP